MSPRQCAYPACGETFVTPIRGKEAVTNKTVWMCPVCRGRIGRPTDQRSEK